MKFFIFSDAKKILTKMEIRFLEILNLLLLQSSIVSLKLALNKALFSIVQASKQLVLGQDSMLFSVAMSENTVYL